MSQNKQFTTRQMLLALNDHTTNQLVRIEARKILLGFSGIEEAKKKQHGKFFTAVLNGDYEEALEAAEESNKAALLTLEHDGLSEIEKTNRRLEREYPIQDDVWPSRRWKEDLSDFVDLSGDGVPLKEGWGNGSGAGLMTDREVLPF
jgi:hypothetical protein